MNRWPNLMKDCRKYLNRENQEVQIWTNAQNQKSSWYQNMLREFRFKI